MPISAAEAASALEQAELLYDGSAVQRAVDRMAAAIARDTGGQDPILMCVMNGGLVLTGMLMPRLAFPLRIDYLHATRYRERTFGTELHWRKHHELPLAAQTVVIVDDILDEGHTLEAIVAHCREQGAARVLSAVLVEKRRQREVQLRPDYLGLEVPDRYVFGCGMDYKGYWRNAAGIYAMPAA
jgi:hypoxanthine phosphoribosyltransferase